MEEEYCDYAQDDADFAAENAVKNNFGFHDGPSESAETLKELLETHLPYDVEWSASEDSWSFDFTELEVTISIADSITVTAHSGILPRRRLDPLRLELRGILSDTLCYSAWDTMSFGVMLLQLVEEASRHLQEFRESQSKKKEDPTGWDAASIDNMSTILENPHGVDLSSIKDTAIHLLGQPIFEILKDVPDELRVLHVEPVFRSDLVRRFLERQERIRKDLLSIGHNELRRCVSRADLQSGKITNTVEGMADYLSKATVTFHGSPRSRIASIVRHGLAVPGQKIGRTEETLEVRCGASYGMGIYSSPSLSYASSYGQEEVLVQLWPGDVPGFRMIVCATLMGRPLQVTRDQTRRTEALFDEKAHSHVSPGKMEYIVFDKAQIIPCYVLHIDYGSERAKKHLEEFRKNPTGHGRKTKTRVEHDFADEEMWPAAKKAKAEALKAAATKWFPYGYGSATGTSFKIEEIAEVSDDEEEYGQYQALRGEHENEIREWEAVNDGASWFDEYQTARRRK